MKTAEEWEEEYQDRLIYLYNDEGKTTASLRMDILREALAERDAEVERARAAERIAREILGEREDTDPAWKPMWESARAYAVEEVRGRAVLMAQEWGCTDEGSCDACGGTGISVQEFDDKYGRHDCLAAAMRSALGPSRPPLPPTRIEEGLRELLAWCEKQEPAGMGTYFHEGYRYFRDRIGARIRKILGGE